jgi:phosphotriesterase-related protein
METSDEESNLLRIPVSRRWVLKTGAVAALGAAGLALVACSEESEKKEGTAMTAESTQVRPTLSGPSVETMTGPISTSDLGFTLMHEHIIVQAEGVAHNFPQVWEPQAELDKTLKVLKDLKAKGVDTILDLTVLGIGRDVPLLLAVIKEAGINVIAATGLYTFNELPTYFQVREVDAMADLFVSDITEGIQGTDVKAAVLKCATDAPGITPGVEKVLRAAARAHLRTGVPISTHTHAGMRRGLEQQDLFESEGVDLRRVIIGHSGDSEDLDYLTKLANRGSYLGMDRFGIDIILPTDKRVAVIVKLCQMGYAERMVLSHDASVYIDSFTTDVIRQHMPNWNYFHIVDDVIPALLQAGVNQEQVDTMTRGNPRRIFENVGTY